MVAENEELRTLAGTSVTLREKLLVQFRTFLDWRQQQLLMAKRDERRARAKAKVKARAKAKAKATPTPVPKCKAKAKSKA